jgi:hypothetical protein
MATTVKVNGAANTLVHKGSNGVSTATIPDVCKTPSPGGPVPIPYPNISQSSSLAKGSKTVKADGGNMIAIKGSEFSRSNGDEAGTVGGVKSNVNMKESTWILYSFDVKIEGKNACRLSDKKFHNKENTVNLAGEIQTALGLSDADFQKMCEQCQEHAEAEVMANEEAVKLYGQAKSNPAIASGPDAKAWVEKQMGQMGPVTVHGATNPNGTVEKKAPQGPCGPLDDLATDRHEAVHQDRAARTAQVHGPPGAQRGDNPAFDAAWEDKGSWCTDEEDAHGVSADTYSEFLDECAG